MRPRTGKSSKTMSSELPTEEERLVPICCWCAAPLVLENRIAWCSGSDECRQKQMACAVTVDHGNRLEYLFVPSPKQTELGMVPFTSRTVIADVVKVKAPRVGVTST